MIVYPVYGDAYFTLKYSGDILDTPTPIPSSLFAPSSPVFCHFYSGQNTGLVDGVTLTGQTSGAVIRVDKVIITSGSLSGSDAMGILLFTPISGKIVKGENLRVSTTTYCITQTAQLDTPYNLNPRALFMSVESANVRVTFSPVSPTTISDTPASFGHIIQANEDIVIMGHTNIRNFQVVNADTASNATITITLYY